MGKKKDTSDVGAIGSTVAGAGIGGAGVVGAVSAAGAVTGLGAAGITSGLAAVGAIVGGGMAAGLAVVAAVPIAAGGAGYGVYRLVKRARASNEVPQVTVTTSEPEIEVIGSENLLPKRK